MQFSLVSGDAAPVSGELLVIPLFEGELVGDAAPAPLATADSALDGKLRAAATQEGFKAKVDQSFLLHTLGRLGNERVLLLGLGNRARFQPEVLRLAAGRAAKTAQRLKVTSIAFRVPATDRAEDVVRAVVEGLELGVYRFDKYKSAAREDKGSPKLKSATLALPPGSEKSRALDDALNLGLKVAEAVNWARDLVNEPPNVVTPVRLAQAAQQAAKEAGLQAEIGGRKEIERLNMGMFLGVTVGSAQEPRLIHLVYTPKNAKDAKRAPLALVGKAITFDSGGLSLKPTEGMVEMKTDMAGSAAVLAAMKVIGGVVKPPFPVHAFIGACENMPSGTAYKPGDILTARSGKTVEITNTDAEGRLVLGDMLTWAGEHEPSAIIDLATLTGACMVALGNYIVGAFGDDDATVNSVLDAAKSAGEEMWRLPISDMQKDALRSDVADMKNSGERWGGAINAALFLKEFVGDIPWVHLDIAGPSNSPKERGYLNKGATGSGARTLVELVRRRAADVATQPEPKAEPVKAAKRAKAKTAR
ncbi:leucyl aminopeptidase [Corallococcus praedator]|uniref:Probable cytosol aminopeptidase n=1 Tax=Corallococcus praedator TaxID=2316724 RepID=A0ABX9QEI5_9BACT|nr:MULTISPECIES: leucyl aminopeptidase [Corallococcus]RKH13937.1 leucyl aminopeptidase [Corallococcus sp. CA047B]RKH35356.1 leucyl aminopeptidase [Corallococcus sp. CA031C]RKI02850.1 leucyl aminopeptidase [Corallococcus praedator]